MSGSAPAPDARLQSLRSAKAMVSAAISAPPEHRQKYIIAAIRDLEIAAGVYADDAKPS